MSRDFDLKRMILTMRKLEWRVSKLMKKFNVKDDDPLFNEENPDDIIYIRRKNY